MPRIGRRHFTKLMLGGAGALSITPFNIIRAPRLSETIVGHGEFRYRVDLEWGNLDPGRTPIKDAHEMVQDRRGRLILLTNETRNNVIIYDTSGKLIDTWTGGYEGAHGLTIVDEGGEEVLYITDTVSHAVYKTTLDGEVIMTLPLPEELRSEHEPAAYRPTETAVAPNGDIYVVDGYGTQQVLRYDSGGRFIQAFGGAGWLWKEFRARRYPDQIDWRHAVNRDESRLNNAHGIALDNRDPANPVLLITSRMDNAIKRFTLDGRFISNIEIPGAFVCRPVVDGDHVYAAVLRSDRPSRKETGFVTILDEHNRVVSNPAGTEPEYRHGVLQQVAQRESIFKHPHDVCIDGDKNLYIPQWNSGHVYPIRLVRV